MSVYHCECLHELPPYIIHVVHNLHNLMKEHGSVVATSHILHVTVVYTYVHTYIHIYCT